MSQRRNVTGGLWEHTPVGDLDVLHLTPVDHLVFLDCDCGSGPNYFVVSVFFSPYSHLWKHNNCFGDFQPNLAIAGTFLLQC